MVVADVEQVQERMKAVGVEEASHPTLLPLRRLLRLRQRSIGLVDATADDAEQHKVLLSRLHVFHIEPRNRDLEPLF